MELNDDHLTRIFGNWSSSEIHSCGELVLVYVYLRGFESPGFTW